MMSTWKSIPFFAEHFAIVPHTATARDHIGRAVSVAEFAQGGDVTLWACGDEYHLRTSGYPARHIEGPAAVGSSWELQGLEGLA